VFDGKGANAPAPFFFPVFIYKWDYSRYSVLDISDSLYLVNDEFVNNPYTLYVSGNNCYGVAFTGDKNLLVYEKNGACRVRYSLPGIVSGFFNNTGDIVCCDTSGSIKRLGAR
jgi:hypothetical protein